MTTEMRFAGRRWVPAVVFVVLMGAGLGVGRADVMRDLQECQNRQSDQRSGFGMAQSKLNPQYCAGLLAYKQKDYAGALAALETATQQGSGGAAGLLGYMYQTGHGVRADPQRAFGYFMQAAKMGSGDGMHEVARAYQDGNGVAKNQAEADRWFKEAEAHGTEKGPVSTGSKPQPDAADLAAADGEYKAKDYSAALVHLHRAADAGAVRAIVQIGLMYERGEGLTQNYAEAFKWYSRGAAMGDATAEKNLGYLYENGWGTAENWMLAAQWYQKSAAQAYLEGEFALGRAYEFGIGVEQDRPKAITWFERAGAQGQAQGAYFAKWLAEPTNFIGFRNQEESNAVMGGKLRFAGDFLGGDPSGRLFRNSGERNAFMAAFSKSADFHESQAHWGVQHNDYLACQSNGGGMGCHNPGPPPAAPQ